MAAGITLNWSIKAKHREAKQGDTLLLATNGRVGRYGPARWSVWLVDGDERCMMAEGEVWQGTRYQALERQAMYDAEQRALLEGWIR